MKYNVDTEIKSTRTGELVTIEYLCGDGVCGGNQTRQ